MSSISLRLPESLHKQARELAKREDIYGRREQVGCVSRLGGRIFTRLLATEETVTESLNPKAHAREAIDRLPDDATWDDVMYELYVRESIDAGLADVAAGRTVPQDQVRARLRDILRRAS